MAVMMLEYLTNKGLVRKDLRSPAEVMPNARVPVYAIEDKGKVLVEMFQGAEAYRTSLEERAQEILKSFEKYRVSGKPSGSSQAKFLQELEKLTKVTPQKPTSLEVSKEQEVQEILKQLEEKQLRGATRVAKIVKRDNKWFLYSKDGKKRLGGPYDSRGQALKRLRQVEFFKHRKGRIMENKAPQYKVAFRRHPERKSQSAWIVYQNEIPAMLVNAEQAFGESEVSTNEVISQWVYFSSPKYGEVLRQCLETKGIDKVIEEEFGGHATHLPTKVAQVQNYTPYSFSKDDYVRSIPTGKIGRVVDTRDEWYCVNYGDIIDYTMAELLEKVNDPELEKGHVRELTDMVERPQEYNITNQMVDRIKDLPEVKKRAQDKGAIEMVDRMSVAKPPIAHADMERKAQVPTPAGDVKVGPPMGEQTGMPTATEAPAPAEPTPKAEPSPALVTPEGVEKMKGTQFPPAAPISEVILQILASLVAASNEWTVAQALEDLRNVFSNQRELDLFQGRFIELVEANKQRSKPALVPRAMNYTYCIASLSLPKERVQQLVGIAETWKQGARPGERPAEVPPEYVGITTIEPAKGDYVQFVNTDRKVIVGKVVNLPKTAAGKIAYVDVEYKEKDPTASEGYKVVTLRGLPLGLFSVMWNRAHLENQGMHDVIQKLEQSIYEPSAPTVELPKEEFAVLQKRVQDFEKTARGLEQRTEELTKENESLKQTRTQLERKLAFVFKLPRARRLAQRMLDCFITDKDQTEELLKLSDEKFLEKEREITEIHSKLQPKLAQLRPPLAVNSQPLIDILPSSVGQSEDKEITPRSPKTGTIIRGMWSRPGNTDDINSE
jgi:hypothetical protein